MLRAGPRLRLRFSGFRRDWCASASLAFVSASLPLCTLPLERLHGPTSEGELAFAGYMRGLGRDSTILTMNYRGVLGVGWGAEVGARHGPKGEVKVGPEEGRAGRNSELPVQWGPCL